MQHFVDAGALYAFDRIYGACWETIVQEGAKDAVTNSAVRCILMLETP